MYKKRRYAYKTKRPTDRIIQAGTATVPAASQVIGYVFEATDPCTATKFKLDCGLLSSTSAGQAYALVYVPHGYNVNNIVYPSVPPANMYEPSQNVLISGVLTNNGTEDQKYCRYGRKMRPGDRIALIFRNSSGQNPEEIGFELNFTTVH